MAVTAILDLQLKPDMLDKADEILHQTLIATRAFAGNQGVTVLVDVADPTHVIVHELWESVEHDAAYRAWRATAEGKSELGTLLAAAPGLTLYTVAEGV